MVEMDLTLASNNLMYTCTIGVSWRKLYFLLIAKLNKVIYDEYISYIARVYLLIPSWYFNAMFVFAHYVF